MELSNRVKIFLGITSVVFLSVGGFFIFKAIRDKGTSTGEKRFGGKSNLNPEVEDPELSKKFNIRLIPDGKNNYRSAQITMDVYPDFIKKYGIKNVVRMNGDDNDSRHTRDLPSTSIAEEKAMCEKLGCKFQFINAHSGYKRGNGYVESLKKILPIIDGGNTLVHCAHGQDRTGYIVATYLLKSGVETDIDKLWAYTTKYNGWQRRLNNGNFFGSGFDKYADAFYPLDKLAKSKWAGK